MKTSFLDLFAGCGGLSSGFHGDAYFKQIVATDSWQLALDSLALNQPGAHTLCGDLGSPDVQAEILELAEKNCDVLIGGPPCQGFSTLGSRSVECEKSALVDVFVDMALKLKPKIILMENVRGLVSKLHPNGRRYSEHLRHRLGGSKRSTAYKLLEILIDCRQLGLAQTRTRYVCIGIRGDQLGTEDAMVDFSRTLDSHFKEKLTTVRDAIGDLPKVACRGGAPEMKAASGTIIYNHQSMNHSEKLEERFNYVPPGGGLLDVPKRLLTPHLKRMVSGTYGSGGHVKNIYGRLEWDKPCGTIVAGMDKITCGRFVHPVENRLLTPRECARLQGFSDDYRFLGGLVSQYYMIGNAVPPLLSNALASATKVAIGTLYKASKISSQVAA